MNLTKVLLKKKSQKYISFIKCPEQRKGIYTLNNQNSYFQSRDYNQKWSASCSDMSDSLWPHG